jgi:hypothetical protein
MLAMRKSVARRWFRADRDADTIAADSMMTGWRSGKRSTTELNFD